MQLLSAQSQAGVARLHRLLQNLTILKTHCSPRAKCFGSHGRDTFLNTENQCKNMFKKNPNNKTSPFWKKTTTTKKPPSQLAANLCSIIWSVENLLPVTQQIKICLLYGSTHFIMQREKQVFFWWTYSRDMELNKDRHASAGLWDTARSL